MKNVPHRFIGLIKISTLGIRDCNITRRHTHTVALRGNKEFHPGIPAKFTGTAYFKKENSGGNANIGRVVLRKM